MAMKNLLFIIALSFSLQPLEVHAQSTDVAKNISTIKRDTTFLYAEATMKELEEAYVAAQSVLEVKVGDWVRAQHPSESIDVCIAKAKEHCFQVRTRRGDYYRAFVYVKKDDILPIADRSEAVVFEVAPEEKEQEQPTAQHAIILPDAEELSLPSVSLTPDEEQMIQVKSFYNVQPYIDGLKKIYRLKAYGKYATMPSNENCHLFVYNKQGQIEAVIRKTAHEQINLGTLATDDIKKYKNCGAIWFQLK